MPEEPTTHVEHSWFGPLCWHLYGDRELLGSIDVDPAVREPRENGDRDVEVLIECTGIDADRLPVLLDRCQAAAMFVLGHLREIRRQVAAMAPPELTKTFGPRHRPLIKRLFLDGLEFDSTSAVTAVFDFGDLDQLRLLHLASHRRALFGAVVGRPQRMLPLSVCRATVGTCGSRSGTAAA